ncbi:MAG: DUF4835 family protein [Bacteroidales bacterium]|jgi:hypothetical protein|nr:DUF4835 family protein [Bacteroidales bacterium]MCK9498568.1 DUF4835 family protein [Bacteroidales bacterium]MDY0314464.1 DUF4835 family protein [Bacteroidales bacterium]NLB87202.1 DUF4835 family protein [Bacteroidales bacterium]
MRHYILIIILTVFASFLKAQELDCRIQLNHSKIPGTVNDKLFQDMQQALYEFINNTNWTSHVYSRDERIECNIFITVEDQISSDEFKGKIQVTSSRPVFGTSYMSPVFNHLDNNFHFKYVESEPLEFNINSHTSNLTSIIAYYCYIIIGMDYDTFGNSAGTPYFQLAERIVQNAQSAQEAGWKAYENLKNRYWLVENLLNNQYSDMRDFMYVYHRQGMDKLAEKPAEGRSSIESAIDKLKNIHRKKPGSFLMSIYTTAKGDEIINVFSEGFPDEKARVYNIMKEADPANATKYEKIMKEPNY